MIALFTEQNYCKYIAWFTDFLQIFHTNII